MLGSREERYLDELVRRVRAALGPRLVGAYLIGSGALGSWVSGRSDLDVLVCSEGTLPEPVRTSLVRPLLHAALPCPARKLELVVYRRAALRAPGPSVPFEVNLNTGAGSPDRVRFDPADEPAHWFLIDVAIAREHARVLCGPPPAELIGPVARGHVLAALAASIRWHAESEPAGADGVLNACRAWRFAEESVWSPKDVAGRWALDRGADAAAIAAALAAHAGRPDAAPDARAAERLLERAAGAVDAAARLERDRAQATASPAELQAGGS